MLVRLHPREAPAAARAILSDEGRVRALAALAPHLPEADAETALREALAAARAISSDEGRVRALAALAPHLPEADAKPPYVKLSRPPGQSIPTIPAFMPWPPSPHICQRHCSPTPSPPQGNKTRRGPRSCPSRARPASASGTVSQSLRRR